MGNKGNLKRFEAIREAITKWFLGGEGERYFDLDMLAAYLGNMPRQIVWAACQALAGIRPRSGFIFQLVDPNNPTRRGLKLGPINQLEKGGVYVRPPALRPNFPSNLDPYYHLL